MAEGWLLVRNAASGADEREAVEAAREELGAGAEVVATDSPGDLDTVVDRLDGRRLVVCGGDGSLHAVVACLHERGELPDTILGLVPLGTGNDLAGTLGLPDEPAAAARVVRDGAVREVDLLVAADGRICVNALHAGVGVDAAERAAELKDPLGQVAYPLGAAIAGVSGQGLDITVELDGRRLAPGGGDEAALMVVIANGRTIGGGSPVAPPAVVDDGRLDVVVSHAVGARARAGFGAALAAGTHLERDDVVHATGSEVTLRGEPVVYNVDGELGGTPRSTRTWRIQAGAWRVLSPPPRRRY